MDSTDEPEIPDPDPVAVPIESSLDLHTFLPKDIGSLIPEYLRECQKKGLNPVRLIHGKGTGALREGVHRLLDQLPEVESYGPAQGNWGATLVTLRPL